MQHANNNSVGKRSQLGSDYVEKNVGLNDPTRVERNDTQCVENNAQIGRSELDGEQVEKEKDRVGREAERKHFTVDVFVA